MPKRSRRQPTSTASSTRRADVARPYINFLADAVPKSARATLLRTAPPDVIKRICDAAYNLKFNEAIRLPPQQARQFSKQKRLFRLLVDKREPLEKKRAALQRGGALPFLPVLLGSALATLGAKLFLDK